MPYQENDQPSIIETLNVGIVKHIWESPREDQGLPHEVVFKPNGRMYSQKWFNPEGEISRDNDLPAQILYYNNDSQLPYKKSWFRNGERYRFNGPAVITFDEEGNTLNESHFFIDGILSRTAKEI